MTTHAAKFSSKWKRETPACMIWAMRSPRGATSTNQDEIDCKRCRKEVGLPELAFKRPTGKHSDKANTTLQLMGEGLVEAVWSVPEIEWSFEKREILERSHCRCYGLRACTECENTGKVWRKKTITVQIGRPIWAAGARFTSRYFSGGCHCGLCNKAIRESGMVPVQAQDKAGGWHAMWVGEDCARKMLNVTPPKLQEGADERDFATASNS